MSLPPVAFFVAPARTRIGGDHRDVGGDRVGVAAFDEVLRHAVLDRDESDLIAHDLLDRHLLEALLLSCANASSRFGPVVPVRPGLRERVAAAALRE